MTQLSALWLPILLSAILVFIASSIIHMSPLWHKTDYPKMPNEEKVMDALRPLEIPPGDYMLPRCSSMQEFKSPEFSEKLKRGPVMVVTVMPPGPMLMGRNMGLWFVYLLVVGAFVALVAGSAVAPGASHSRVFHFVALSTLMAHTLALWQMSIWYRRAWSSTIKATFDGVIYALLTAGVFCWLWPT